MHDQYCVTETFDNKTITYVIDRASIIHRYCDLFPHGKATELPAMIEALESLGTNTRHAVTYKPWREP
jgi:hypothetical protein